ncbi:MAG TPA: formylglycine-generating enzyme family protein [Patescibacteria group bacterium]|nr:formylglycine-generating enzyme family protein [Patescibacteria group bacterium]
MRSYFLSPALAVSLLPIFQIPTPAFANSDSLVYETPFEFFGSGDLDGDGRPDVVIIDKETGKYRLGYQMQAGVISWVDCRPSGIKGVTGFTLGKLLTTNADAVAFTSPDANQITVVDASSTSATGKPQTLPFTAALGPNTVLAVDAGSVAKSGLMDLYVGSIYNSPDVNLMTLLRNDGAEFPKLAESALSGPASHANHMALQTGQPEAACFLVTEEKGDSFHAETLQTGKPVLALAQADLPSGSDYAVGHFRKTVLPEFLFYKPGQNSISLRPVEGNGAQLKFAKGDSFDLGQPVRRVVTLPGDSGEKLLVVFGTGEKAGLFDFDGIKAPVSVMTITATNELFTCATALGDGFVAFTQPAGGKFSNKYRVYKSGGNAYTVASFGSLPSLADNDNITIPDIAERISSHAPPITESDMKPYTNTIPGTRVTYAMVPIHGGEFVMGSPDNEPKRKSDEGPQHKVKVSPFWMEQFEVTWNEYELFMYPDEEKRTRATVPSDNAGDKLADAVTHPSKPYVEMSFGMGKDGFPAIAMTQHAANKYCQWLSAKTGHFYRLPTEAEWEYACRAGTTTTYFFGNDESKLGDYAWFEQNSDFKYQKVGRKKPNPWGLYDMYGNVVEWVLDQYDPDYYKRCASANPCIDPWNKATKPYPHSVRGGSWDDEASMCRSAARRGSDRAWKMQDPQLPKSVWYFSDAQWVGFRVVRPLKVPSPEQMQKYWSSGVERD